VVISTGKVSIAGQAPKSRSGSGPFSPESGGQLRVFPLAPDPQELLPRPPPETDLFRRFRSFLFFAGGQMTDRGKQDTPPIFPFSFAEYHPEGVVAAPGQDPEGVAFFRKIIPADLQPHRSGAAMLTQFLLCRLGQGFPVIRQKRQGLPATTDACQFP